MVWARAVWFEYSKEGVVCEYENTIPSNWIKNGFVYWRNRKVESAIKKRYDPTDDWLKFKLKYVKITGILKYCVNIRKNDYNNTFYLLIFLIY